MLYKARINVTKSYDDYSSMILEAKNEATKGKLLKILTPKQMLQRLPIALVQVQAGNNSENLVNEIRQISKSHILILKVTNKIDLRRGEKSIALSILVYTIHGKT